MTISVLRTHIIIYYNNLSRAVGGVWKVAAAVSTGRIEARTAEATASFERAVEIRPGSTWRRACSRWDASTMGWGISRHWLLKTRTTNRCDSIFRLRARNCAKQPS